MKISQPRIVLQNLRLGEKTLKDFNGEYPYFQSSSKLKFKILKHRQNPNYQDIIKNLSNFCSLVNVKIKLMRTGLRTSANKYNYVRKMVKNEKIANCGECAFLMSKDLESKNIKHQNIFMCVNDKDGNYLGDNHSFILLGADKNADYTKPSTWGKNAVIVDGWANFVSRAADGLDYLKQIFNVNQVDRNCEFRPYRYNC